MKESPDFLCNNTNQYLVLCHLNYRILNKNAKCNKSAKPIKNPIPYNNTPNVRFYTLIIKLRGTKQLYHSTKRGKNREGNLNIDGA